ncbi:MAG: hypothetical protein NUV65_05425 [Candidatus Roizmanbacteria bacterium]|nr:hypothetical protein [Candidatus Roizmanbacteria bacterium]
MVKISSFQSHLLLDIQGGRIYELTLHSHKILGTYTRVDGKVGNSHVCAPNFSAEGIQAYGLSQHGSARNRQWSIESEKENACTIRCTVPPEGTYPSILSIEQQFVLENNSFTHVVTVTNQGNVNAPVNIGLHYYWDTPDGWEQLTINNKNISRSIAKDTYIPAHEKNRVRIQHKPAITLETGSDFSILQLWTGRNIVNNQTIFDTAYACIEPVFKNVGYFDSPMSMLKPKDTLKKTVKLSI